jgi:hypothetical protein
MFCHKVFVLMFADHNTTYMDSTAILRSVMVFINDTNACHGQLNLKNKSRFQHHIQNNQQEPKHMSKKSLQILQMLQFPKVRHQVTR